MSRPADAGPGRAGSVPVPAGSMLGWAGPAQLPGWAVQLLVRGSFGISQPRNASGDRVWV